MHSAHFGEAPHTRTLHQSIHTCMMHLRIYFKYIPNHKSPNHSRTSSSCTTQVHICQSMFKVSSSIILFLSIAPVCMQINNNKEQTHQLEQPPYACVLFHVCEVILSRWWWWCSILHSSQSACVQNITHTRSLWFLLPQRCDDNEHITSQMLSISHLH